MNSHEVRCKACGQVVEDTVVFCPKCSGRDFEPSEEGAKSDVSREAVHSEWICARCNTRNEHYAVLCSGCGEKIVKGNTRPEMVKPTENRARSQLRCGPSKLLLVFGSQSLECRHGDVLGRDGTLACDLFRPIPTVSGKHIAVELRNDSWFLINLPLQPGRTAKNLTEVDGLLLKPGESIALSGEHVLRMSSRCEVRLRVVPPAESLEQLKHKKAQL